MIYHSGICYSCCIAFIFILVGRVGCEAKLTNGCIIGAGVAITDQETIPENTVIFGTDQMRRIQAERPAVCINRNISALGRRDNIYMKLKTILYESGIGPNHTAGIVLHCLHVIHSLDRK